MTDFGTNLDEISGSLFLLLLFFLDEIINCNWMYAMYGCMDEIRKNQFLTFFSKKNLLNFFFVPNHSVRKNKVKKSRFF